MQLAMCVRGWAKDDHRVGAVIVDTDRRVLSLGYNGFPAGVADLPDRLADKHLKRSLTVHAELNAILNATASVRGGSIYVTRFPCHECAKAIIQAGIARVVSPPSEPLHLTWGDSHSHAMQMFHEVGIVVEYV